MGKFILTALFCVFFSHSSLAMDMDEESFNHEQYELNNLKYRKKNDNEFFNKSILNEVRKEQIKKSEEYFIKGIKEYKCRNFKESFYYLKKSALYDHNKAEYTIGLFHEFAIGTERNFKLAKHWYSKSKEHGNKEAKDALQRIEKKENSIFYWMY